MDSKEFAQIRSALGKTQGQMAKLLCISNKAIQSFEQGWRKIPSHTEREILALLALKRGVHTPTKPCWEIKNCPDEWRVNCLVWEFQAKHFCWFFNGTFCQGKTHEKWADKIKICRQCEIFQGMMPDM